ncbi:MAG: hypothetical protein HLUCCA08_08535 [Rhodobacteraceae bacterium HLUCCA08]|nr:MAG: hypothetical protein HLUCCA08_08535 [Rhodobacteraceae bacterium HLUCCA08]
MAVFDITRWPAFAVFVMAGTAAALFAFISVNLFSRAMASVRFLGDFGWTAIRHGALWQVGELLLWGGLTLICWLAFKIGETELSGRYRAWADRLRKTRRSG